MCYTGDPLNRMSDRIRLIVGDTDVDNEGLSDREYEYIISKNTKDNVLNEKLASVEVIKALMARYAGYVSEKTGALSIQYGELFRNYKDMLNILTKDPRTSLYKSGKGYAGGIYIEDIIDNAENDLVKSTNIYVGWSKDDLNTIDKNK